MGLLQSHREGTRPVGWVSRKRGCRPLPTLARKGSDAGAGTGKKVRDTER